MQNSSILKNKLIFEYAAGTTSLAKSLMASTYLFLNSHEASIYNQFENYCGEELKNTTPVKPEKLTMEDCITKNFEKDDSTIKNNNPVKKLISSYTDLKWKKVFRGFYEHSLKLSTNEYIKLIKMDPGTNVPLHSHNGKEYILVLEGSFTDEYGTYSKGSLQINDSKVKHTPFACDKGGCICLTITEKELVFYGPFAPILNLLIFIKSLFFSNR